MEEEIAKALKGNNRQDYLFGLKQEFESYGFYQKQIEACDKQINHFLKSQINAHPEKKKLKAEPKSHKRINKNTVKNLDINQAAFQYFNGVDLMRIEGLHSVKDDKPQFVQLPENSL